MTTQPPTHSDPLTPGTMRAVRLHLSGSLEDLRIEDVAVPRPGPGEVLVQVHAAAITRDELEWPADRLPAIPSYELSGVVVERGSAVDGVAVGDAVCALTRVDRDGVAAGYAVVPVDVLAPKAGALGHVVSAALPMAALNGSVRPTVDSVFPLADGRAAFARVLAPGKKGKVVIEVLRDRPRSEGAA